MISVLIADDHPLVRQGLRAVLDATEGVTVVGEAADGQEAVRLATQLAPDVVVMDLQMPVVNGIEATRQVASRCPGSAVLVLTMFDDDDTVFAAVAAGASGYLLKGADGADISAAVRAAAAGQAVFGAGLASRIRSWFANPRQATDTAFPQLSEREREILDGVAAGLTNGQIAEQLFLSPKTVANNVSTILTKLQVSHRSEAIARARQAGLGRATPETRPGRP